MGNANGKVVNNSRSNIIVRTYNNADLIYSAHNQRYEVPPGGTQHVEAAADHWGLKIKITHPLEDTGAIFLANGATHQYSSPQVRVENVTPSLHALCLFDGGCEMNRTYKVKFGWESSVSSEVVHEHSSTIKAHADGAWKGMGVQADAETSLKIKNTAFSTERKYGEVEDTIHVTARDPVYVYTAMIEITLSVGSVKLYSPTVIQSKTPLEVVRAGGGGLGPGWSGLKAGGGDGGGSGGWTVRAVTPNRPTPTAPPTPQQTPTPSPARGERVFTLASGDNPYAICQREFGDGMKYLNMTYNGCRLTEQSACSLPDGARLVYRG
ncbi:hypothetical protein HYH03_017096 [Edaphochlamys debaryana]|uniref:Uncharacterized protein n=1 Tax=Edaphochlamys debaryana TaxID=47281 RepID=A0A836BPM1_9CHLO|nr:hypothetical protein HYH03_017096 [Edaphochlamys debaryana]|eukprot:KAG2484077.1 hypothetical protein HYH03_017096 [Edaphochlamys debaryana]